jgi:hypothetical protein
MFKPGERVLIKSNEINPLSECFVKESTKDRTICTFSYAVFSGEIEVPTYQVYKHPIDSPSFIYKIDFRGNEIPSTNDFEKYFKIFQSWEILDTFLKSIIACFKKTFEIELEDGKEMLPNFLDFLKEEDATDLMNFYISENVLKYPEDFRNTYILEYSLANNVSFINSDKFYELPADIFLKTFSIILILSGLVTRTYLIDYIKDELNRKQYQ